MCTHAKMARNMAFGIKNLSKIFSMNVSGGVDTAVGVDIGSSSIKIVQLKRLHGSAVLETYGELQLGPYAGMEIGRATNLEPAKLTEALTDVMGEASITSTNAALAVPYASSFVTVITLPAGSEEQLSSVLPIEARKYVPVPVSQVTLDWFVIPETKGAKSDDGAQSREVRVLLAAIHNEALSKYRSVVQRSNLSIGFTEIEIFSTIRSSVQKQEDTVMIIDLGAATTKLYVVSGGVVQLTHNMSEGGQNMTLALSKSLELSVSEAEELKRQVGIGDAGGDKRISQALNLSLERIQSESKLVLERYERMYGNTISKIVLSGGGAVLQGLPAQMESALGHPVVLSDPFSKIECPAFLEDTLKMIGPSFAVSLGVALRRLGGH